MAPLNFNFLGWAYQDGVRSLRDTFAAATEGVKRRVEKAYRAVDEYDRQIAEGKEPETERDEDGHILWDQRDVLINQTTTAEEAGGALRKAIAIAAFHHWERSARQWTGIAHGRFQTLRAGVIAEGYPIDPRLGDLHLVVNLLKHANPRHGRELLERRPQWFRRTLVEPGPNVEWYEEISLSEEDVDEFFEVVAGSDPDMGATAPL